MELDRAIEAAAEVLEDECGWSCDGETTSLAKGYARIAVEAAFRELERWANEDAPDQGDWPDADHAIGLAIHWKKRAERAEADVSHWKLQAQHLGHLARKEYALAVRLAAELEDWLYQEGSGYTPPALAAWEEARRES